MLKVIAAHEHAITNKMGSSSIFAASLGLQVHFIDQATHIHGTEAQFLNEGHPDVVHPSAVNLFESMKIPPGEPRPNQKIWGDIATGRSFVRSPDDLQAMIREHAQPSPSAPKPKARTWDQELDRIQHLAGVETVDGDGGLTIMPEDIPFKFFNRQRLIEDNETWNHAGILPDLSKVEQPVIIDCGCDTGFTSIQFSKKWPGAQIYAFEANPAKVKCMFRNLDAWGLRNLAVSQKAVWVESGLVSFETREPGLGNQVSQIKSIRLKDLLREGRVDLMRFNIANAILPVVQDCGSDLRQARHLIFNYPSDASHRNDFILLLAELTALGFQMQIHQVKLLDQSETSLRIVLTASLK